MEHMGFMVSVQVGYMKKVMMGQVTFSVKV